MSIIEGADPKAVQAARDSYSGRGLTEAQFEKAWAVTSILRSEIETRGTFMEVLIDQSHLYARREKFDALRGEAIIRDVYTSRYGQTMNATREAYAERAETLPEEARAEALAAAERIAGIVQDPSREPYYLRYDALACDHARKFEITRSASKKLIGDEYQAAHGRDIYADGKALEASRKRAEHDAPTAEHNLEQRPALETRQRVG